MAIRFVTVNDALDLPAAIVARLRAVGLKGEDGKDGKDSTVPGPPGKSNFGAVSKRNGAWGDRPDALKENTYIWVGPEPSPPVVTTGTGGMYEHDLRLVTGL